MLSLLNYHYNCINYTFSLYHFNPIIGRTSGIKSKGKIRGNNKERATVRLVSIDMHIH